MSEGRRNITVLLAEDEEPLRKLFEQVFDHNGFRVLSASNGNKALHLAARFDGVIDLLVSNIQMPEMTGPELARELRKSRPDIKIMLLSGTPDSLLMLDKGWVFLSKPVLPSEIIKNVEHILDHPPSAELDRGPASGLDESE